MATSEGQQGKQRGRYSGGVYDPGTDTGQTYDLVDNPAGQQARREMLEASIFERSKIADPMIRRLQSRELAGQWVHNEIIRELETLGKLTADEAKSFASNSSRVMKLVEAHGLGGLKSDAPKF